MAGLHVLFSVLANSIEAESDTFEKLFNEGLLFRTLRLKLASVPIDVFLHFRLRRSACFIQFQLLNNIAHIPSSYKIIISIFPEMFKQFKKSKDKVRK